MRKWLKGRYGNEKLTSRQKILFGVYGNILFMIGVYLLGFGTIELIRIMEQRDALKKSDFYRLCGHLGFPSDHSQRYSSRRIRDRIKKARETELLTETEKLMKMCS